MRYPASEKLEIIRIVEQSHQPIKRTLQQIGVSRPTFYRWYDLYRRFGEAALVFPDEVALLWDSFPFRPDGSGHKV